jgi:serine/threonine-protein kinase HipA
VDAFLWGLLPDNENVLARWGREFQVSSRNPFALLAHVGEDCAGAVQIVPADRLDEVAGPGPVRVDWLGDLEVAERLHALRNDETAWSRAEDGGRFSLAGAQPTVALFYDGKRWGIPSGRTPTTHLLKPPTGAFDGQRENEHCCLQLARKLGMPTASSKIVRFENETAIVLERYDRVRMPSETGRAAPGKTQPVLRLHQEDMCQALAVRPQAKYQNEGGPSPEQIADLLRDHSDEPRQDLNTFLDALLFNWLIGGSDGHAKNYSLLHGAAGRVRLAPLYDVASALPYPTLNTPRLKLAMKIGGHYRLREIGAPELRKLAASMKLSPDAAIERAAEMCTRMPKATREIADACAGDGLDHPILEQLVVVLSERAQRSEARLQ